MADSPGGTDQPIQLTDLACSDTVADRAFAAAARTAEWFRSDPMQRLLDIVGVSLPNLNDGATTLSGSSERWLHLGEELPAWVLQLANDTSVVDGWAPELTAVTRACLDCIDLEQACADALTSEAVTVRTTANAPKQSPATSPTANGRRSSMRPPDSVSSRRRCPQERHYDLLLVLGGGYRSPLLRAEYASELVRKGVSAEQIAFLGSPRLLIGEPPESPAVQDFAPGAADEYDLMCGAATTAFGFQPSTTVMICGCPNASGICPPWLDEMKPSAEVLDPVRKEQAVR